MRTRGVAIKLSDNVVEVTDLETGKPVREIRSITIRAAYNDIVRAEIEVLPEAVFAKADATIGTLAMPSEAWHEDIGPVLWWRFPVDEPPYVGSPLDRRWPGYHTHWTPIDVPKGPL